MEESVGPIAVIKNGHDAFVAMRSADFDRLVNCDLGPSRQRLLDRIAIAEQEKAEGRYVDCPETMAELGKCYGL